jgi:hypothetical protein
VPDQKLLDKLARETGSRILASSEKEDGSIVFVTADGRKVLCQDPGSKSPEFTVLMGPGMTPDDSIEIAPPLPQPQEGPEGLQPVEAGGLPKLDEGLRPDGEATTAAPSDSPDPEVDHFEAFKNEDGTFQAVAVDAEGKEIDGTATEPTERLKDTTEALQREGFDVKLRKAAPTKSAAKGKRNK